MNEFGEVWSIAIGKCGRAIQARVALVVKRTLNRQDLCAFKGQANRVLSVVLYLNPVWGCGDGGEMVLYSDTDPSAVLCKISPHAGTLVVFLSEDFPHEVLPALRDRYSIAGWFRVD